MISQKNALRILSLIFLVVSTTAGRSVYVINDTTNSQLQAYKIEDANLIWQANYVCKTETVVGIGAVGLAVDESEYGEFLFVTFEGESEIELVNAKTMQYVDMVTAEGSANLAGIVADQNKSKVYTMERYTNHLYSYSWDPSTKTLTPDFNDPYYIELQGMEYLPPKGAFGIALDEENDRLYVADNTTDVKYYDTNDPNWSKLGEFIVTDAAIGIAIDVAKQYVYTGNGTGGGGNTYLSQYDLSADPNSAETTVDVNSPVLGIAVDQQTSLVYITTYGDGDYDTRDRLIIYDSNLVKQPWESGDIGNPAGVCVPTGEVSYKPLFPLLTLVKDNNDPNDDCVLPLISEFEHKWMGTPYNWLYYNIDCNANGHSDTNVKIIDYLPKEVDEPNFISDGGVYDSNMHTVTWNIGDISPSDSNTFLIQVAVNYYAKPGHKIYNYCEIEGDDYFNFTTEDTNVCCYGGNIIYVDEDANDPNSYNNGTSWFDAYRDLQDAFHTARNCASNQIWVAEGTYKPTDINDTGARLISFELLDDVAVYGGFPTGGGTWFERNPATYQTILSGDIGTPNDLSDNSYHVVKCQDVNNAILDGFTIKAGNADFPEKYLHKTVNYNII